MAASTRKTRPETVPRVAPPSQAARALDRLPFCRDIDEWPRRWMGFPEDLPPGERLVQCFRPFLHHLIQCQLSQTTLRKHVNNVWVLGGEIIRKVNDTPSLRKVPIDDLVFEVVEDGGPLPYGCDSEVEGRSFESTCRKLRRFLEQQRR
jgi:hypothetical protein